MRTLALIVFCGAVLVASGDPPFGHLAGSASRLPLAADVDVAVVGGTSAAVAAAVEAGRQGARVFLAAPRLYLGEDLCATYRLWLEPGEEPRTDLERRLFADPTTTRGARFSYQTDLPSASRHPDTDPPSVLTDGQWGTAFTESVQYDGDVRITADLGAASPLTGVRLMFYQSSQDYEVETIAASTSLDGQTWQAADEIRNPRLGQGAFVEEPITVSAELGGEARYLRFAVRRTPKARRVLLGEIQIVTRTAPADAAGVTLVPPLQVKRGLEEALIRAGVEFLYGCYATAPLRAPDGRVAGLVMTNRAGRQAVKAKVVIDATDRAWFARLTGAEFAPYPAGEQTFTRVVLGGEPRTGPGLTARQLRLKWPLGGRAPLGYGNPNSSKTIQKHNAAMETEVREVIEYTVRLPVADASFAAFAAAEQAARDLTFHPRQLDESEVLFQVPPDPLAGRTRLTGPWPGADTVELGAFQPQRVEGLYITGGCADVSREAAARLLRPLEALRLGTRIGAVAAAQAKSRPAAAKVDLTAGTAATVPGSVRESLAGIRSLGDGGPTIEVTGESLPVWKTVDVVVVGGGTAGAPAAIGAARRGAKVLTVEYLHGLGGVGTTGLIGLYCAGYRKGFTAEVDAGVAALQCLSSVVGKTEWWRREARRAGGEIWFGAMGAGAVVDGNRVTGVVVATPQGRGVVLAKTVIDATGNGDTAAAAGAEVMYTTDERLAMQGAGLPQRELGAAYINTDWTFVDDQDMVDVRSALISAKKRYQGAYDLGQLIDTRERRRIRGEYVLSPLDIVNARTFPDTVGINQGGRLDTHGPTVHPYFYVNDWKGGLAYTPYRCLLPRGWDGILVVGLAVSAHRDAIPCLRMQPCTQNLGYAAGAAAAMAVYQGCSPRAIDIRALQQHLVETGCLTPEVMTHRDSYPLPPERVQSAIDQLLSQGYDQLGAIMAAPEYALPRLRDACRAAPTSEARLRCAHVLGLLGDAAGVDILAAALRETNQFEDQNIGSPFPCVTWTDSYIIALGRTRDPRLLPPVLEKLRLLLRAADPKATHCLAVAEALEQVGDRAVAQPLAELLEACGGAKPVVPAEVPAYAGRRGKDGSRNLVLARALYRCGDWQGLGERVLRSYADDVRGVYARHARAVLRQPPGHPAPAADGIEE